MDNNNHTNYTQTIKNIFSITALISITTFFISLSVILYSLYPSIKLTINSISNTSKSINDSIPTTIKDLDATLVSIKNSASQLEQLSISQYKELNDPQAIRSRRLLYQSGDNLFRLVLKSDKTIEFINDKLLPNINNTVSSTNNTINTTNNSLSNISIALVNTLNSHSELVQEAHKTLTSQQPNIDAILANAASTLANSSILLTDADITLKHFNDAFPILLQAIVNSSNNIDGITKQILTLATSFNQKDPKIIRAIKLILQAGIAGLLNGIINR